jgi:hypothetical protein
MVARDVYSLIHFPMLCGVVAYAVAIEEAIAQAQEPLLPGGRLALAVGLVLFIGGMGIGIWRATRHWLLPRLILVLGTAIVIVAVAGVTPLLTLAIAFVGILVIVVWEQQAIGSHAE